MNRRRRISSLMGTTALLAAALAMAGPAQAQSETTALDAVGTSPFAPIAEAPVIVDVLGGVQVDLKVRLSVVNWKWFNVVDNGRTINFADLTGLPPGTTAVLNRAVGDGINPIEPTVLNGTISSSPNVAVWVTNPEGIALGSSFNFVGGTLVLTTGPITTSDFRSEFSIGVRLRGDSSILTKGVLTGDTYGILASAGAATITNSGTVTGNGQAAIQIEQAASSVSNSGTISGANFGITTAGYFNSGTGLTEGRAIGTIVDNSGTIRGLNNDGVRLIGGGTVTNSGLIEGLATVGADGVSMFTYGGQDVSGFTSVGTVTNLSSGTIFGNRFGIILSTGGEVNNAGSISGNAGGVAIQDGDSNGGKTGTVSNSGSIGGGTGVSFGVNLTSSTLTNSGSISGTLDDGVSNLGTNPLAVDNQAGGTITGALKGIHAAEGAVLVTNAGYIRGNGTYDGFQATPDGGISIGVAGSSISNSGSISGARFGITTYNYYNAESGLLEPRAVGTTVTNLAGGSIIGDGDDGVRLIGGGTVTNAGLIEGRNFLRADGVSMFALEGQDTTGQASIGTVINQAGGTIFGDRFGIGLSGGGVIENAGTILAADFSSGSLDGFGGGVLFQAASTQLGKTGTLTNSGSITGGNGVLYGAFLASGLLTNSGSITGTQAAGVQNTGANLIAIDNQAGGSITGARIGIWGQNGEVTVSNAGTIAGNGGTDAAIVIEQAGSTVSNSGLIQGANFGIATNLWLNPATGLTEGLATGISVVNLAGGQIVGANNDGIRFNGSGTVSNAGVIEGRVNPLADGISISPFSAQDVLGDGTVGSVVNSGDGRISGARHGVIIAGGGTVDNGGAGSISGNNYGVYLIGNGTVINGTGTTGGHQAVISGNSGGVFIVATAGDNGRSGLVTNLAGGAISGGNAITFSGVLASAELQNAGVVTGVGGSGLRNDSGASAAIGSLAGGSITGATWGILGRNGAVVVDNAGSIFGNGVGQAGIQIEQGNSSVSNSGLIQGANFGITANPWFNSGTGQIEARATNTLVDNSGTIRGLSNDGVRLQGGGTVSNSGLIEGVSGEGTDGISMFAVTGQDVSGITSIGTVDNLASGSIRGNRFGIILSTGGVVQNAGSIWAPDFNVQATGGIATAIVIQDGLGSGGKTASIANTGTISAGVGISFAGDMAAASISNSGSIAGRIGDGVNTQSNATLSIVNLADGSITGARSGIYSEVGALTLTNAGTIRGNGINSSFNRTDAGVVVVQPSSTVANSGTISGTTFGITTAYLVDGNGVFSGRAIDTQVTNSGTIRGDSNDGVRLIGGGTVTNSGLIEGLNSPGSDGVSMFRYDDQDVSARPSIGTVINQAGGTIFGDRFGIILSGGGYIENDGTIRGNANGLLIQAGKALAPYTGTLINRGSIENGARFNNGVTIAVTNSGTITTNSPNAPALESLAEITVVNTGTISVTGTHAIRLGIGNDRLTLGTGSLIVGISDGGDGLDTLRLESGTGITQALGRFDAFESLDVISGTWTVAADSGAFNAISIAGGELAVTGSIAGNVATSGAGTLRLGNGGNVAGFTGNIVNDGQLIVDIGTDFDISGDFSGTGSFTKDGTGTLSFLGAYGFTGTTTLLAGGIRIAGAIDPGASFDLGGGTLDLSGSIGTTIAGLSGDAGSTVVLGSSSLTVNQDLDTVFAGSLSGTGSLIKDGDGRLNLTGTSTYTGPTIVSGGTLAVNGSIVSPVTVQSGATLGGTGTTGTVTIETGGTFNPGNSIGTIRVVGPLNFRSGSTFAVETSPTGSSDRINVTGRVTIDAGAGMSVLAGTGNYRPSTTYVVLTATDRVVGRFGSVSTDLAFLEPKLDYASKKVELTLKRRNVSFASVAATSSQAAVASAVESMGLYNSLYDGVLNQNVAGARSAFEALSGGFYGQISNQLLVGGSRIQDALQEKGDPAVNGPAMWATAESGARTGSGPAYRSGFSLARDGLQVALVTGYLPFERLGSGQRGSANVETQYSGVGVSYASDGWTVGTGYGVAWHSVQANRSIAYAGFADGARAEFRAMTQQAFGEVSYRADLGSLALSPFAGLSTSRMAGAEINETGGTASLSILSRERQLNLATLGVRASGHVALPKGLRLIPRVELGWQWAGGALGAMQSSQFFRNGAGFNIIADELGTNGLTADVGMELQMGSVSVLASYQRNAIARDFENGAQVGLRVRF